MSALASIVLAGGQSSRMGRDKALIEVAGVPMLRRVWAIANECAAPVYVVTPWADRYRAILPPTAEFVQEPIPTAASPGPLVGFALGLAAIEPAVSTVDWVLLLACDLPRLEAAEVYYWKAQLAAVPPRAIALLPRHPKGWDALCGFYRPSVLPNLQAFIESGGRSFQAWLAQTPEQVAQLTVASPNSLFNCNTPADL